MSKVLVLGAGKIGAVVADMLSETGDYTVTLADNDRVNLDVHPVKGATSLKLDVKDVEALGRAMVGHDTVVSALPFFLNPQVVQAARDNGLNYFDLTEDVRTARAVRLASQGSRNAFMSQCGLAPGFIAIVANHLIKKFDQPHDVRMRVGALPQFPDNALRYNLTWSTDGLINEYCNPCEAIHQGERREILPLEGLERISLDGVDYEAFSTSGGVGTLCETLDGVVRNLMYKTIRYPGHLEMIKMLAGDLKLCEHRETFKKLIEYGVPVTQQDVVLIYVTVTGMRKGMLTQESYTKKIYGDVKEGGRSAIQKTTAAGVCSVVDMHRAGKLPHAGFLRQEEVDFNAFIANRFGQVYA